MKRNIILLVALFHIVCGYGQINKSDIIGKWIQFKMEMKDGSRSLSKFIKDSTYSDFTIYPDGLIFNSNPILKRSNNPVSYYVSGFTGKATNFDIKYTLEGNLLKTSATSGFLIEKLANDTLIICEKIDGLEEDKLTRKYYINQKRVVEREYEKVKNKKDIIANKFFTPKLNETLENEIFKITQNYYLNLDVIGTLTIFPKSNKVTTEITYSSKDKPSKIKIITDAINNSFEKWDLEGFKEFESIKIPFILSCETYDKISGVKIYYFTNNLADFKNNYNPSFSDMRKYQELFDKGVEAYDKKNFTKAADYFSKAYKINPRNLDALYNQAAAYHESGDKENACKIWKELADFGQTNGIQLYKNNCN